MTLAGAGRGGFSQRDDVRTWTLISPDVEIRKSNTTSVFIGAFKDTSIGEFKVMKSLLGRAGSEAGRKDES